MGVVTNTIKGFLMVLNEVIEYLLCIHEASINGVFLTISGVFWRFRRVSGVILQRCPQKYFKGPLPGLYWQVWNRSLLSVALVVI